MCNVGAIGLGIQGVGLIGNYISAKKEQDSYSKYYALQTQATLNNYIQQTRAINNRYIEEQQAAVAHDKEIYIQNLQAKASAEASAASSGIDGISIENLFKGYDRATAVSNYTSAKNLQMKGLQYNDELDSLRVQAINSINLQQQYTGVGTGASLLNGIGGLLTGYSNYKERQARLDYYTGGKSKGYSFFGRGTSTQRIKNKTQFDSIYTTGGYA